MKRAVITVMCVSVLLVVYAGTCVAADSSDDAAMKSKLVWYMKVMKIPEADQAHYTTMIHDPHAVYTKRELFAQIQQALKGSLQQRQVASAGLDTWLYMHRHDPGAILDLYQSAPIPELQDSIYCDVSTMFPQLISPLFEVIGEVQLKKDVDPANSSETGFMEHNIKATVAAGLALEWLAAGKNPKACAFVTALVKHKVVDPEMRTELVMNAAIMFKKDAFDLAQWYYRSYCTDPTDLTWFNDYFAANASPEDASQLYAFKRTQLQDALKAMPQTSEPSGQPPVDAPAVKTPR